jgi:hypothetical protein
MKMKIRIVSVKTREPLRRVDGGLQWILGTMAIIDQNDLMNDETNHTDTADKGTANSNQTSCHEGRLVGKMCGFIIRPGTSSMKPSSPSPSCCCSPSSSPSTSLLLQRLILLTAFLAVGLSIVPYFIIRQYQAVNSNQQFQSGTKENYNNILNLLNIQLHLNLQFGWNLGFSAPLEIYWPNLPIPYYNMYYTTRQLIAISQVNEFVIAPIVTPTQRQSFETVAKNYYETDGHFPPGTGVSDFGTGIYDHQPDGTHLRSANHTDLTTSNHDILIPLFLTSNNNSVEHLMSNLYSFSETQKNIDETFDCFETTKNQSSDQKQRYCSSIMNYPSHLSSEFAALSTPIFPHQDDDKIVALMLSIFSWKNLLTSSVRHDFDFQCSISVMDLATKKGKKQVKGDEGQEQKQGQGTAEGEEEQSNGILYKVEKGQVTRIDKIDEDNPNSLFPRPSKRSHVIELEGVFTGSTVVTITYYPSTQSASQFFPLVALFSCVALTTVVSIIFISFIILINRETCAARKLLETKRIYVRFISHEIRFALSLSHCLTLSPHLSLLPSSPDRTPLNTIKLSLHLLAKNIEKFQEIIHRPSSSSSSLPPREHGVPQKSLTLSDELSPIIAESLELLMGLEENSSITVSTLNDLINYDKIETNTFAVENKEVDLWPLIAKTIFPLSFLAAEKNIRLEYKTHLSHPMDFPETTMDLHNLYAIGDAIKLGQVIRNLVSNALKFTPIGGDVKVSGLNDPYLV